MDQVNGVEYLHQSSEWTQGLIDKLKVAFCEEMQAWYSYVFCKPFLVGGERSEIEETYEENGEDEYEDHAEWLLERLNQLNAQVDDIASPSDWKTKTTKHPYIMPTFSSDKSKISSTDNLKIQVKNELGAIETYQDLVEYTKEKDPVTYQKAKEILADEEEHYQALIEHLADIQTGGKFERVGSKRSGGRLIEKGEHGLVKKQSAPTRGSRILPAQAHVVTPAPQTIKYPDDTSVFIDPSQSLGNYEYSRIAPEIYKEDGKRTIKRIEILNNPQGDPFMRTISKVDNPRTEKSSTQDTIIALPVNGRQREFTSPYSPHQVGKYRATRSWWGDQNNRFKEAGDYYEDMRRR